MCMIPESQAQPLSLQEKQEASCPCILVCLDSACLCLSSQGPVLLASPYSLMVKSGKQYTMCSSQQRRSFLSCFLSLRQKAKQCLDKTAYLFTYLLWLSFPSGGRETKTMLGWWVVTPEPFPSEGVKKAASWEKSRQFGLVRAMGRNSHCFQRLARMGMGNWRFSFL